MILPVYILNRRYPYYLMLVNRSLYDHKVYTIVTSICAKWSIQCAYDYTNIVKKPESFRSDKRILSQSEGIFFSHVHYLEKPMIKRKYNRGRCVIEVYVLSRHVQKYALTICVTMVTFRGDQCSMRVYESASSYPVVNNHLLS